MIECSCRVLTTKIFQEAVDNNREKIAAAPNLSKAIARAYLAASKDSTWGKSPVCATMPCRGTLAKIIQDAGFHTGEEYQPKTGRLDAPIIICRRYRRLGHDNQ